MPTDESLALVVADAFTGGSSSRPGPLTVLGKAVQTSVMGFFAWFGELAIFCGRLARVAFVPPWEGRELLRQMDAIGSKSLPLVALAGAATGVVLSLQTRDTLLRFGAKSMLPAVIIFSILKESGPIITGLIVSGRVGAGIGAELGSMKVTEQINALEASAVDPYKYLVATRVLACIAMLPLLTLAADFCGILMGWVSNTLSDPISLRLFLNTGTKGVTFSDFLPPTLKTAMYGLIIGIVSCFQGMRTQGGTGRRGKIHHQRGGSLIAFPHSRRCSSGAAHSGVFPVRKSMDQENKQADIAIEGLCKSFGPQKVLNGFTLNVAHGETVAVLGRSGTGKSVLLRLLIGLQQPDSGCIRIQGQEITGLVGKPLNEIRKKIGFLFQQGALYDSLTVEQNVEFPLSRHTALSADNEKGRARELLASVGMEHDGEKMPSQISGGMQKRVALARALALGPAILLLDEPTAGLDPITAAEIENLISQLQKNTK